MQTNAKIAKDINKASLRSGKVWQKSRLFVFSRSRRNKYVWNPGYLMLTSFVGKVIQLWGHDVSILRGSWRHGVSILIGSSPGANWNTNRLKDTSNRDTYTDSKIEQIHKAWLLRSKGEEKRCSFQNMNSKSFLWKVVLEENFSTIISRHSFHKYVLKLYDIIYYD